jgi:signal transduction histidine kinase
LKNAIDAVKEVGNPAITITTQRTKEGKSIISVADNGRGIEKELLEQIFIPFYTTKPDGSGIGLSLSRQIMRMHKGRISVQSAVGEGTVFTLSV